MEYGFAVPTDDSLATPDQIVALANKGEELGFEFISVSYHMLIPKNIASRYPYGDTGRWEDGDDGASDQVAGDIRAFEQAGVRYLHLNFQTDSLTQTLERMERFACDVRPLVED